MANMISDGLITMIPPSVEELKVNYGLTSYHMDVIMDIFKNSNSKMYFPVSRVVEKTWFHENVKTDSGIFL
jgi:hypothetical protein